MNSNMFQCAMFVLRAVDLHFNQIFLLIRTAAPQGIIPCLLETQDTDWTRTRISIPGKVITPQGHQTGMILHREDHCFFGFFSFFLVTAQMTLCNGGVGSQVPGPRKYFFQNVLKISTLALKLSYCGSDFR